MSDLVQTAAETVLTELATKAGVQLDAVQVVALAEKFVGLGAELVAAHGWRASHQVGMEAQAKVTTVEEAEAAAKRRT